MPAHTTVRVLGHIPILAECGLEGVTPSLPSDPLSAAVKCCIAQLLNVATVTSSIKPSKSCDASVNPITIV